MVVQRTGSWATYDPIAGIAGLVWATSLTHLSQNAQSMLDSSRRNFVLQGLCSQQETERVALCCLHAVFLVRCRS